MVDSTCDFSNELTLKEYELYVQVAFKPEINCVRRKELKARLIQKYVDKLIFIYEKRPSSDLHFYCAYITAKSTLYSLEELKAEFENYFGNIRGCSIDKLCGQLTFYSPPKDINIKVTFYPTRSSFEVRGDVKNLSKFLHGYSNAIREINSRHKREPIDTSSLTMASLSNHMTLCERIERGIHTDSLTSTSDSSDLPSQDTNDETQSPMQSPSVCDPQFVKDTPDSSNSEPTSTDPTPFIPETPDISPTHDQKLDLMITKLTSLEKKLSSLEENTQKITPISAQLNRVLALANDLNDRLNKTEEKLKEVTELGLKQNELKTSVSKLDCRIFDLEGKHSEFVTASKSIEKRLTKVDDNHVNRVHMNDLEIRVNIQLKELQQQITTLNVARNTIALEGTSAQNVENINKLIDDKLSAYENNSSQKQPTKRKEKYKPTTIENLDHDILLIGDSNTFKIKEGRLKHGLSATKIMAYKIEHAITALQGLTPTRAPLKLMCHLGTNHISSNEDDVNDLDEIKSNFTELFDLIDAKFPETDIYLSELFIRRERKVRGDVKALNEFLKATCSSRNRYYLIQHSYNIDSYNHLRDNRHLNMAGFYNFLSNIRLHMFGMPRRHPRLPSRNEYNHRHENYYDHRHENYYHRNENYYHRNEDYHRQSHRNTRP